MKATYFSIQFRRYTTLAFLFSIAFFAYLMGASASDHCPKSDDYSLSAEKYKMFTAYQTAYDGYQVACEIKCFEKKACVNSCQSEKALISLNEYFQKTMEKKGLQSCDSLTKVCLTQCQSSDDQCMKACKSEDYT